jgi:thiopeptide-type bacteriocin biosynthesis protein
VAKEELRALGERSGTARFQAVREWRTERGLPRLVGLADGDSVLPFDLENALSIESFVELVRERAEAAVVEIWPPSDRLCARAPEGRFVHELVIPFVRAPSRTPVEDHPFSSCHTPRVPSGFRRRLLPGSDWLYAKLYTGAAMADAVLTERIAPVVRDAITSGAADRWFFVRYADPEIHLRIRFHGEPQALRANVLDALGGVAASLLDDGWIWRFQLDTYEREVERYGGPDGVELAERIFHIDSDAVLEILQLLETGDEGAEERWRIGLVASAQLLDDLGINELDQRALWKRLRREFGREFGAGGGLDRQLGRRFRAERTSLESLLEHHPSSESQFAPGFEVLRRRSEQLVPLVATLRDLRDARGLSMPLIELAPSYVHMHLNRLLRSTHRAQELVLYDFLARLYESKVARTRGTSAGAGGTPRQ